jgi:hypothetical protein
MTSLDNLPADQRAVLQLVLQRGRSYDEIAELLSINRAAVRERALTALDALGPHTSLDPQRQALITDYLLGQLPPAVAAETRERLAAAPDERAWARVIASELAPLAAKPLPEIPSGGGPVASPAPEGATTPVAAAAQPSPASAAFGGSSPPRSSRIGGIILIALAVIAVVVVVVVLLSSGGGSKHPPTAASTSSSTAAASGSSTTSSTSSTTPKVLAQINLKPLKAHSQAIGVAEVLKQGTQHGVAIVAQHVTPNTTKPPNAYAVWLYNTTADAHLLGFVNPGVGKNGRLSTAGGLPSNAAHYKQLIVTLETKADPKAPGTIILSGALTGLS